MEHYIARLLGPWSTQPSHIGAIALRVVLVLILSAIIGSERATKRHPAGLRTFMLAGITSVLTALCDEFMVSVLGMRVAIVSACYILCLATVCGKSLLFTSRNQLKELTTSICLLTNAVLSLCIGYGMYTCALIGFGAMILCMVFLPSWESSLKGHSLQFEIHLELKSRNQLHDFITSIRAFGLHLDEIEVNPAYATSGLGVYTLKLTIADKKLRGNTHAEIIDALSALDSVAYIEEIK